MSPADVTVRFDILWRPAAGGQTVLATATHTFPAPATYTAVRFATDIDGIAADAAPGDRLVLRFNVIDGGTGAYYIPNGDGEAVNGETVNLTLPAP